MRKDAFGGSVLSFAEVKTVGEEKVGREVRLGSSETGSQGSPRALLVRWTCE